MKQYYYIHIYSLLSNIAFCARILPQSIREMTAGREAKGAVAGRVRQWGDCYLISLTENELVST